ncbi:hypothetical protein BZA05DRAFT_387439 [Tricharina praecox]|uniref:uncharacterized protein n=1 Tax=Tricharina praecox TaxID=43433 RepID=UPI00221EA26B|nr:uncharacterized protein BZA05DRAFT_387439 [Tricharina praecox]KAI5857168.1 hypothetical protein BZA05DRAFT_387439 [Tricharina praecox]
MAWCGARKGGFFLLFFVDQTDQMRWAVFSRTCSKRNASTSTSTSTSPISPFPHSPPPSPSPPPHFPPHTHACTHADIQHTRSLQ